MNTYGDQYLRYFASIFYGPKRGIDGVLRGAYGRRYRYFRRFTKRPSGLASFQLCAAGKSGFALTRVLIPRRELFPDLTFHSEEEYHGHQGPIRGAQGLRNTSNVGPSLDSSHTNLKRVGLTYQLGICTRSFSL